MEAVGDVVGLQDWAKLAFPSKINETADPFSLTDEGTSSPCPTRTLFVQGVKNTGKKWRGVLPVMNCYLW